MTKEHTPDPVDLHVGSRVRLRRKLLGMSQEALAEAIGLTFQQVQKYERGSNRVSASKLHQIARVLKVPEQYFFDGMNSSGEHDTEPTTLESAVNDFVGTAQGIALAQAFPLLSPAARHRVLALVQVMAEETPRVTHNPNTTIHVTQSHLASGGFASGGIVSIGGRLG